MKKLLFLFTSLLALPVLAQSEASFCTTMNTRVLVRTQLGSPTYISQYSKEDFLAKANSNLSPYTLGLTISKLDVSLSSRPKITRLGTQFCAVLKDLEVNIGYPELTVYIDKKYPVSSCEYQTIKEHEDYHVLVAQQALSFFKPDIEKTIKNSLKKLSPQITNSKTEASKKANEMILVIKEDLQPIIRHINKKLDEKNAAIDTEEMYQATTAVCENW